MLEIFCDIEGDSDYFVSWRSDDYEIFRAANALFAAFVPPRHARYVSDCWAWIVDAAARECLRRFLQHMAAHYGAHIEGLHFTEEGDALVDAYLMLHLLPSAPLEVVKASHKALTRLHHPDRGGEVGMLQVINAAFDLIVHAPAVKGVG